MNTIYGIRAVGDEAIIYIGYTADFNRRKRQHKRNCLISNSKDYHFKIYQHIRENHRDYEGDIFEFGVFRGASLIAIAMLLKQLGSDKKIYGFDSFSGFPRFNEKDSLSNFSSSEKLCL